MPIAQIRALEFLTPEDSLDPGSATADLHAELEDGRHSTFAVATPEQPKRWLGPEGFSFGTPVLFCKRVDRETVAEAAQALAAEMGGYWLRYYNSADIASKVARTLKLKSGKRRAKK